MMQNRKGPGGPMGGGMGGGMRGGMRGPMGGGKKAKDIKGTINRIWSYLKEYKTGLTIVFISVIITTALSLVVPYLIGVAIDKYILVGDMAGLMIIVGAFIAIAILNAIFHWSQTYTMSKIAQKTVRDIRQEAFTKLQELPIKYYDQNPRGILMSKLTNDIDLINTTLSQSLTQLISSFFIVIGAIIIMFKTNWILALVALVIVPIIILFTKFIAKRTLKAFGDQQQYLGEVNSIVEESINGQLAIKLYSQEQNVIDKFTKSNNNLRDAGTRAQIYSGIMFPVMNFMNNFSYALIIAVGGVLAVMGMASVGMIASFTNYAKQYSRPLNQIAQLFNTIQSAIAGAERIFDMMDEKSEYDTDIYEKTIEHLVGHVELKNVYFGYEENKMILKDISFEANPGDTIAIVGPTGSGKTTIINLLNRFYDVNDGEVLLDSINVNNIEKDNLRDKVGVVLQDTYLFTGTVKDNIKYGKLDATDEEVEKAAKLANAHSFIKHLDKGYDSEVVEGGNNLSQGQRQLLSIARTILANPDVLVLDEATSNIDTRTEAKIQESMDYLMQNRTSFVIAHRLQTIKNATKILVLKDGEIIEYGSHDELLGTQGFYYDLYTTQFKVDKL